MTPPLVAHIARPTSKPSSLARALKGIPGQVLHFGDASDCLKRLPMHSEVAFLVERSALSGGGMMWLIVLAESRRGPVILVEEDRDHDASAALRAGVQSVVYAPDFAATAAVQSLVDDALQHFDRRASDRPWRGPRNQQTQAPVPAGSQVDSPEMRAYLRDSLNEFRTPLTAVVEFASILDDGLAGTLNAKQGEYTQYILEACRELLDLYGDFRQGACMRLGNPQHADEAFDLDYAIEEALAGVRTTRVSFRVDGCDELVLVRGDRDALVTAIRRIAERAAKCSARGCDVIVRLRVVAGTQVEVAVIDTGPVPTAGDIRLLNEGTVTKGDLSKSVTQVFGIGLELARAVLLEHGTQLELRSGASSGGQISFSLPIAAPPRA